MNTEWNTTKENELLDCIRNYGRGEVTMRMGLSEEETLIHLVDIADGLIVASTAERVRERTRLTIHEWPGAHPCPLQCNLVYVLRLHGGYYYVGRSSDYTGRMQSHSQGKGSMWTRLHKPIEVVSVHLSSSYHTENNITLQMMALHGINNVRGGSWSHSHLSHDEMEYIESQMVKAYDHCNKCKQSGHFADNCVATAAALAKATKNDGLSEEEKTAINQMKNKYIAISKILLNKMGEENHLRTSLYANIREFLQKFETCGFADLVAESAALDAKMPDLVAKYNVFNE